MKILGWMHRKLRQNNHDVFKEFGTGGGGTSNCITGLASPDHVTFFASANEYFNDGTFATGHPLPPDNDDLFSFNGSGLLTIGTLGIATGAGHGQDDQHDCYNLDAGAEHDDDGATFEADVHNDDEDGSATPTFTYPVPECATAVAAEKAAAVEAIAEKDDHATTDDDLMVVSAELEKVLGGGRSSGAARDSVASSRLSFAVGGVDCPLQGFLFGSPVSDAAGSRKAAEHGRDSVGGGRRTSLGELFMRTRFSEEKLAALVAVEDGEDGQDGAATGGERDDGRAGNKSGHKKKKVKDGTVAKSKFQKILQIFHRKVYPESTALARSLTKKRRKHGGADEPDAPSSPKFHCRKEQRLPGFGCCARASFGGTASPSDDRDGHNNGSKSGHWIRTDADYLVLEL